jgi:RNA polymerase sigma factor (sigma-70 family)
VKTALLQPLDETILPEHDGSLLRRVGDGDLSALGLLYDRHHRSVLRFVRCTLHQRSEAEDVAQEVFLIAARVAASFDGRHSSRAWLFGIAARCVLNRARRGARFLRFVQRIGMQQAQAEEALPEQALLQSELRAQLHAALHQLTPEKRIALVLAEVEGLSGPQIAETLGVPLGTVWTRLHHARRDMREQLRRKRT